MLSNSFNPIAIAPADLLRVLTPRDTFNETAAPGLPLSLGFLPELADISKWPALASDKTPFDKNELRKLRTIKNIADFAPRQSAAMLQALLQVIPMNAFEKLEIETWDHWRIADAPGMHGRTHLDSEPDEIYNFTAIASFYDRTIFNPELSPLELEKLTADLPHRATIDPSGFKDFTGQPCEIMFFNDRRFGHRDPRNNRSVAQWREELAPYPDAGKIIHRDGAIRRASVLAMMTLKKNWVTNRCAELAGIAPA